MVMSETGDGAKIVQAFREHRPYLVDLAFRMLGDIGAAEDAVQDAFTRLLAADIGEIEDERGWLIVVTSRLCLDQLRSARFRRELASDPGHIEAGAGGVVRVDADTARGADEELVRAGGSKKIGRAHV